MTSSPGPTRLLSLFDAVMIVMGGILGVGIFFAPEKAALYAGGDATTFLALWVIGGVLALAGAMTFAELAGPFPRSGGRFVFLREGFGRFPAFLFAWIVLLVVSTGAIASIADFFTGTLLDVLDVPGPGPGEPRSLLHLGVGSAVLIALTLVALRGARAGATFQNVCMLLKLSAMFVLAAAGFVLADGPSAGALDRAQVLGASDATGASFARGMLSVLYTYGGWQLITYIAPAVRDPQRTLPRALLLGVSGVTLVYFLFNLSALRALGMSGVTGLDPSVTGTFGTRFAAAAFGSGAGSTFVGLAMALSALGICAAIILATPGVYVAMAREGLFFRVFGQLGERTSAPWAALWVQLAVALGYFLTATAGELAESVVFAEWIFHALVGLALLRIRATRKDLERPFRSPFYPLFPVAYVGLALWILVSNLLETQWEVISTGLIVLAAGALVYSPWRFAMKRHAG